MNIKIVGAVLLLTVAVVGGSMFIGDETDGTTGFSLLISDAPAAIGDFSELTVPFDRAVIERADGTTKTIQLNGTVVDLTEVIGNVAQPILSTTLEEGNYSSITLHVQDELDIQGDGTTLVSAKAVNGSNVSVLVASGKLQINKNFTIDHTTESTEFNLSKNGTTYQDVLDQGETYLDDGSFENTISNSTVNGSTISTVTGYFQNGLNFVFDIHVVKTGSDQSPVSNSPMDYVLTPNLADSGIEGEDVPEQARKE